MAASAAEAGASPNKRRRGDDDDDQSDHEGLDAAAAVTSPAPAPKRQERVDGSHAGQDAVDAAHDADELVFEDAMPDEFIDSEDEVRVLHDEDGNPLDGEPAMEIGDGDMDGGGGRPQVWHPSLGMAEDEELDYDPSTYRSFHSLTLDWPALSIDVIRDSLGYRRTGYPHTAYLVAGTQAAAGSKNLITMLKLSRLCRNGHGEDSSDDGFNLDGDDDDDDEDMDPIVESRSIEHDGAVNRLRSLPQTPNIVGVWGETGVVSIYDLSLYLQALDMPPEGPLARAPPALHEFRGHSTEGFAMTWSPVVAGRLLTGDCAKHIYLWEPRDGASWATDLRPYTGHTESVEDLQWSPNQADVFASASVDGTVKVWDVRRRGGSVLSVRAHASDVNVISWNHLAEYLLLSGGDDGEAVVWDLRKFAPGPGNDLGGHRFNFHSAPISSIAWHPTEASSFAVASEDDSVSLWDLGVEADEEDLAEAAGAELVVDIPPQLLFVHQGLTEVKEVHWHPQIPGMLVATGAEGLNVWRPINF